MPKVSFCYKFTGRLLEVNAEGAVKLRNVGKWCPLVGDGMTNLQGAKRSGTPSLVTDGKAMQLRAWTGRDGSGRMKS